MITIIRTTQINFSLNRRHQRISSQDSWNASNRPGIWHPPTDVIELEHELLVRVEIAGMEDQDFSVSLDNSSLLIQGVRRDLQATKVFHQMEVNFGQFVVVVPLPCPIDALTAQAEYTRGFLLIHLPRNTGKHIPITPELPASEE